jgi:hypothetical protein
MATIEPVGVAGEAHAHLDLLPTADIAVPGWRSLESEQRWEWFQQLYAAAGHLDRRYRLGLRSGWWEDELQLELLAALAAWVGMFDYASWTDPEGKARLLLQLPSFREALRGGAQTFEPDGDRGRFEQHLRELRGCSEPDKRPQARHVLADDRSTQQGRLGGSLRAAGAQRVGRGAQVLGRQGDP